MHALPAESINGVSVKTKLSKLARKRLERFVTLFAKALVSETPETIHDLRVASRRLQQALRLALPRSKSGASRKLVRMLRKVRRAFGTCRNLDASIDLVQKKLEAATTASLRQSWDTVRLWLEQKRATEIEDGRAELRRYDVIDFIARVQARIENIDQPPDGVGHLWERSQDALTEWRDALVSAKEDPQVQRIHAFRIAGKRLRYRAESLAELGQSSVKPLVEGLKALQNDLGDWHDRSVLRQYIAEFIGRPGVLAEEPGMCRALLLEMEREKQRDHATVNDVIARAEKLAEDWTELTLKEESVEESIKG
ncbi:MAG: CHAD domain-containing protein [Deltaproteobacteria bacterium]|nr:MAG: CHAD domain-containing protein [Deltaproteobacteria bacterium]